MRLPGKLLLSILISVLSVPVSFAQYTSVAYYMVAHPDDWQLFMGVNAFNDIANGANSNNSKVVLIYTTAGEANCNGGPVNEQYYLARQTGANRSVQFCADINGKNEPWSPSVVTIKGLSYHNILRYKYKNTVSYFLRLPDGCLEATHTTLTKFAHGKMPTLYAVDSSTAYFGYEDLVKTVEKIIQEEGKGADDITINCPEWDWTLNPSDHPDHIQTGLLATRIASKMPCVNLNLFEGYYSSNNPPNLAPEDIAKESALLAQVSYGCTHYGYSPEWDPTHSGGSHINWTNRNYFRTIITCDSNVLQNDPGPVAFQDSTTTLNKYTVNVFPNPAHDIINITYEIEDSGMVTMAVNDYYGRSYGLLLNETKEKGKHTFSYNAAQLRPGNYSLYVKMPQNIQLVKFVKE